MIIQTVEFVANLGVAGITFYLFYKRFISKGLCFSAISERKSLFDADSVFVTLENRGLNPVIIRRLSLLIEDEYVLEFPMDRPVVVEPFHSEIFSVEYSAVSPDLGGVAVRTKVSVLADSNRGRIKINLHKKPSIGRMFNKIGGVEKKEYTTISIRRKIVDGKVLSSGIKYIISLYSNSGERLNTIYMLDNGLLSEEIAGGNALPPEVVRDEAALGDFFSNYAEQRGMKAFVSKVWN